jgi:hypothetical protein
VLLLSSTDSLGAVKTAKSHFILLNLIQNGKMMFAGCGGQNENDFEPSLETEVLKL